MNSSNNKNNNKLISGYDINRKDIINMNLPQINNNHNKSLSMLQNYNKKFINKLIQHGLLEDFIKEVQVDKRPHILHTKKPKKKIERTEKQKKADKMNATRLREYAMDKKMKKILDMNKKITQKLKETKLKYKELKQSDEAKQMTEDYYKNDEQVQYYTELNILARINDTPIKTAGKYAISAIAIYGVTIYDNKKKKVIFRLGLNL